MGLLSKGIDSITGVSDARRGIKRANKAQQEAILKGIGTLEGAGEGATQSLTDARTNAGQFFDQGRSDLNSGFGGAINRLNPIAGLFDQNAQNALSQNFTQQGFADQISGFTDPNGAFAPLFDSRQQASTNALGAAGLTRSNFAAEEAARIDLETALGLSDTLFNRQSQNPALQAIGAQSQLQANQGQSLAGLSQDRAALESAYGSDIANLILGQGSNVANLQVGAGASEAQSLQALGNLKGQQFSQLSSLASEAAGAYLTGGASTAAKPAAKIARAQ